MTMFGKCAYSIFLELAVSVQVQNESLLRQEVDFFSVHEKNNKTMRMEENVVNHNFLISVCIFVIYYFSTAMTTPHGSTVRLWPFDSLAESSNELLLP